MNLVDSSAWLEYFAGGPLAARFAGPIEATEDLVVPTVVILEVTKRIMRQRDEGDALQAAALLHQGRVVDLDTALALRAARLGIEHKLPLADGIVLATARRFDATIWTLDADFDGIEGVRYFSRAR